MREHGLDENNKKVDEMARNVLVTQFVSMGAINILTEICQDNDEKIAIIKEDLIRDNTSQPNFSLKNNQLYYKDPREPINNKLRLYAIKNQLPSLLNMAHDNPIYGGHLGIKNTLRKLAKFYWPNQRRDVEDYVRSCEVCQSNRNPKTKPYGRLQPIAISKLMNRIHLDVIGPIKETPNKNRFILTMIDSLSRYGFAKALPEVHASHIIKFIKGKIVKIHGPPTYYVGYLF